MQRPSKKDIKAAVEKLKEKREGAAPPDQKPAKLSEKKDSRRIRKQGV